MAVYFNHLPDAKSQLYFVEPPGAFMGPRCFQDGKKELMQTAKLQEIEINKLRDEYSERLHTLEQGLRCNTLRIFGVRERPGEDPFTLVLHIFREKMRMTVGFPDLQSCYRSGSGRVTPRPIIVRFTSSEMTDEVMRRKSMLKGSKIGICEDLSPEKVKLFNEISQFFGKRNVWVDKGVVKVSVPGQRQLKFHSKSEFESHLKKVSEEPLIIL